ncbi:MAG TPA: MFS transporter, partial [Hypericibacter adhaerens]|uniref:MFS transporter n=1 Tax=Hypericibacter adhaerens TaxID=2602016 RepID=UPI002BA1416D
MKPVDGEAKGYGALLRRRGFLALMTAQFLGSLNDNILKMTVVLVATGASEATNAEAASFIAAVGGAFILPFLLFSGWAGQLADRRRKDRVVARVKLFEIPAMLIAIPALMSGQEWAMLGALFLVSTQAAFFSPAKYGILPEILDPTELSRGNALLESSTFLAIILGAVIGGLLFDLMSPAAVGAIMVAIAALGAFAAFHTERAPEPRETRPFSLRPSADLLPGFKAILANRDMAMTAAGIAWFWLLGAFLQMMAIRLGREDLDLGGSGTGLLQAAVAIGIGVGSLAAGRLSGPKVEPGLVPLGSIGMGIGALWLSGVTGSVEAALPALAFLGVAGGLFIVPLNAAIQLKAPLDERGRVVAVTNMVGTAGILLASGLAWFFGSVLEWSTAAGILAAGIGTLIATAVAIWTVPEFLARFLLWLATHTLYRIRIEGPENVPQRGPALLVCNHMSFVDGLLVGACVQRFVRFLAWSGFFKGAFGWFLRRMKVIPVSGGRDAVAAIKRARAELEEGHVVCIFAEGAISRTGSTLPFKRGLELIADGLDVPVIPVHLDQVWGSIFSYKGGRFFWKWPERLIRPVTVSFGKPLARPSARAARRAVLALGSEAWARRAAANDRLQVRILETAKRRWRTQALMDTTGRKLRFGEVAIASILLAKRFRSQKPMVGIVMPASVAAALVNAGLMLAGKTPVNLNFTAGPEGMASMIRRCRIETVITAKAFLEKAKLAPPPGALYVEDLLTGISKPEKLKAAAMALLLPARLIARLMGGPLEGSPPPATVMFSSGSTGEPKGAILSHRAIIANLEAVAQVLWIDRDDVIAGVLPFFHSFGFTGTLCLPLVAGIGAAYHANPLDAKAIGPLVKKSGATALIGTPTFLQAWTRAAEPDEMKTLRHVVTGAERLRPEIADAFAAKFGLRPLEGFGMTEMGPVVAVNSTDVEDGTEAQAGQKEGTVGRPIPGVAVRTVDPETGAEVPDGAEGMLLVKGPGMMDGYIGDPARTAEAMVDGWYRSGDIALIDEDGFIKITGRLSRFSKIAGEMVPHGRIEDAALAIPGLRAAIVVGVPDPAKGEKIVLLYEGEATPEAVLEGLGAT